MGKQLVDLKLLADLTDSKGNLTAGGLIRASDATYVNTAGALAYSRGTRTNLVLYSEDTTQANWVGGTVQTFTLAINTTYILSVSKTGAILTLAAGTGAYNVLSGTTATPGSPVAFTMTTGGTVTVTTNTSNPKAQLEALPSGNVIGSDLMDQEALGAELVTNGSFTTATTGWASVAGAINSVAGGQSGNCLQILENGSGNNFAYQYVTTTAGKVYKITYYKKIGAGSPESAVYVLSGTADPSVYTESSDPTSSWVLVTGYFISTVTGDTSIRLWNLTSAASNEALLIDEVSVKEVTSPAKGSFHGTAMLAGSTELVVNGGFETAGAGAPDLFGTWTETTGGTDTIADSTGAGTFYLGAHAALLTYVDNGATYVANTITTTAGKLYKLEFYTMATAEDKAGRYSVVDLTADPDADIVAITTTGVTANSYTKVTKYFVTPALCTSVSIRLYTPTEAGGAYYDYVSVRQVQTTWTRAGTNTLEIDEAVGTGGALKITWIDDATGASLNLANASDQSADLVVGETYQVTFNSKVTAGSVTVAVQKSDATVLASVAEAVTASMTAHTLFFKATATATDKLTFSGMAATEAIWIDDLTIKSVPDLAYLSPGTYTATTTEAKTIPAEPRFEANGLLVEGEGTNFVTYSGDFTNAAWVKSNITAVYSQTSPSGAALASSLTAGAANGTALFTVADGGVAANKTFSVWLKRVTGTGNIDLTDNNGSNWTTQTLTTSWAKYTLAARSQAIPIVGIRIVTSGDVIHASFAQNEISAYATSSIPTNGCPVTRLTEAGSATNGYSWTKAAAIDTALGVKGTVLLDFIPGHAAAGGTGTGSGILAFAAAAANAAYYDYTNTNFESADGTNTPENDETIASGTTYTLAVRWDETADGGAGYLKVSEKHGGTWTHGAATAFDGAFVITGTKAYIGYGNEYPFWIKNVKFFDGWVKDANLDKPVDLGSFPVFGIKGVGVGVQPYTY